MSQVAPGSSPTTRRHAVVIGASMTGLLAARVLANHFDRVTILDRDRLPEGDELRAGVPQARHVHVLLLGGRRVMEQLFPGLENELRAAGAVFYDQGASVYSLFKTGWAPRVQSGLEFAACSRTLLESRIRRRVAAMANVEVQDERDVTDLLTDAGKSRVLGVRFRRRDPSAAGGEQVLEADLVVDTSGRSSRVPEWLTQLGYGRPEETVVNAFVGYATRWYEIPSSPAIDWSALWIQNRPPHFARNAIVTPAEGGRWVVSLYGHARDYPPTDEAGFLEFARSMPTPLLYEVLRDARPISPIYGYRNTENRQVHYDKMARWPERLLVMGDSYTALNPTYAQGMSVAALSARELDEQLRAQRRRRPDGDLSGLERRFQQRLAKVVATSWMMATSEDARWPTTEGRQSDLGTRVLHWYMDQLLELVPERPDIYEVFLHINHMITPPTALFHPRIVAAVLRRAWTRRRAQPEAAASRAASEARVAPAGVHHPE
jgi:2-polyprenyl-6-methoxyphenol hydroxylase-like FAD-dependent oxidoreductase